MGHRDGLQPVTTSSARITGTNSAAAYLTATAAASSSPTPNADHGRCRVGEMTATTFGKSSKYIARTAVPRPWQLARQPGVRARALKGEFAAARRWTREELLRAAQGWVNRLEPESKGPF